MKKSKPGVSPLLQSLMGNALQPDASAHNENLPTIEVQSKPGAVRFVFSRPAEWIAFSTDNARSMAAALIAHANVADGLNEDGSPKIAVPSNIILLP